MTQFAGMLATLDESHQRLIKDRLTAAYNEGVEEGMARFIYALLPYDGKGEKPKWVERGNSDKQEYSRRQARGCIRRGEA